jgi:tetratricopeptide (TPR) repeat protein
MSEEIRTQHLKYFLAFSEKAEIELRGPAGNEWVELLDIESNNIQSALQWAEQTDAQAGLQIASRLARYWEFSNLRGGIHWLERFLQNQLSSNFLEDRAHALFVYGWLLTWHHELAQAQSAIEESLAAFRSLGNQTGEVDALTVLAHVKQFLDKSDDTADLLNQALLLSHSLKDEWREANVNYYLGWDRTYSSQAVDFWEKALSLYTKTNDRIAKVNILGVLGLCMVLDGKIEMGESYLNKANRLWESYQHKDVWQNPKIAKSLIALSRGDTDAAYAMLEEAREAIRGTSNRVAYYWLRARQGYVFLRANKLEQAKETLLEAAQNFLRDGYMVGAIFAVKGLAGVHVEKGEMFVAARLIGWTEYTREEANIYVLLEQNDLKDLKEICVVKLGEIAYHQAYEEGSRMQLDDVLKLIQNPT